MKKLIILLTIAAMVCLTFTAMAAGDGIAFEASTDAINEGETLQTVLIREGAAADRCTEGTCGHYSGCEGRKEDF